MAVNILFLNIYIEEQGTNVFDDQFIILINQEASKSSIVKLHTNNCFFSGFLVSFSLKVNVKKRRVF